MLESKITKINECNTLCIIYIGTLCVGKSKFDSITERRIQLIFSHLDNHLFLINNIIDAIVI